MTVTQTTSMTVTQTTSSAGDLQAPFAVLLLLLFLLLSVCLHRLQEANDRIRILEKDMQWWKEDCMWYQCEYDRRHAALRTGDCHMRVKGDGR